MSSFAKKSFFYVALALISITGNGMAASRAPIPINTPIPNDTPDLTMDEVTTIIGQAVGALKAKGASGVICIVDREGHILAIFRMTKSAAIDARITEQATAKARTAAFFQSDENAFTTRTAQFIVQPNFPPGIRNLDAGPLFGVPFSNFPKGIIGVTTQTLDDVQTQVPPFIVFVAPINVGELGGNNTVPLANIPAGSTNRRPITQPLVITPLTDDLGGLPLFKGKRAVGGIGIEIDGFGVLQEGVPDAGVKKIDPTESKATLEESVALTACRGFLPRAGIRANKILINGFRFLFTKAKRIKSAAVAAGSLAAEGAFEPYLDTDGSERSEAGNPVAAPYTRISFDPVSGVERIAGTPFVTMPAAPRPTPTQEFPRRGWVPRFPPRDSPLGVITAADVTQLVQQAADQAIRTRAGIRNPRGVAAQVWICVVDKSGNICGSFRTEDATPFSFDVHVQKARTAAFFSNDQVGFSSRAIGFMAQTFYPPGVDKRPPGPISGLLSDGNVDPGSLGDMPIAGAGKLREISQLLLDRDGTMLLSSLVGITNPPPPGFDLGGTLSTTVRTLARRLPHIRDGRLSPLQVGITVDLTLGRPTALLSPAPAPCTIPNGITIFPGGVPIYKGGVLVGGLGVSGDGVDQDDIIAFAGQAGFRPPEGRRSDEASEAAVRQALSEAVVKLKAQFPNLTNGVAGDSGGSGGLILDVITDRLKSGLLQGLRLPYVKFPRQPNR